MFDMHAKRLTGLLSTAALMLLLLMPVLASASPMPADQSASGMMAHEHDCSDSSDGELACWQQCLSSCTSHCAPVLTGLPELSSAGNVHGALPPNLYHPLFPSGLHRPPRA
ncbi:hypothetical protein [Marinobacterium sediminicola]|uniref:CopL family metal-binding regulatory protein n=1 Tax=Marinobacterium sediminicola TaxID=518898 RepID=A0ABY1RXW1_9GAMM|nr:hypothetical protein [Marinobacterium sediminicola]ULG68626.1 hypothetical protein LN244_13125 [Marinobacterium sediminicola]SMR73149.1 hypothetical protein SAMN04487964_10390 [Marinobacterium sediminicola]